MTPISPDTGSPGPGCRCRPGCRPGRPGRTGRSAPSSGSSTRPGCGWPGLAAAAGIRPGPTSTPSGSRAAGLAGWPAVPGGEGSGTAAGSTCCSPTRHRRASGTAATRRTGDSARCTGSPPGSSPPCCCTGTSTRTAPCRPGTGAATPMPAETGFPRADVADDFMRARRRQVLSRLAHRLRGEPDDVNLVLPFDDVVAALGLRGERYAGLQTIRLDSIVGTVDSRRDFDRHFRPTSSRVRERWERLALAQRRGEAIPPIEVYRIGDLHFVKDGHHRVSIAIATGQPSIDAYVTEVQTTVPADSIRSRGDLLMKDYERMFRSRVPLPEQAYARIRFADPWAFAELGEAVEAWGFRYLQHSRRFLGRDEIARLWYAEEFLPVVRMLHAADLVGSGTEAEAYQRVARERYRLMRTHEWSDEVIERLRREIR